MNHEGTFGMQSGRQLIVHAAGRMANDPHGDNCPLCIDPAGCPRNATSLRDCLDRRFNHPWVQGDAEYLVIARTTPCPKHEGVSG